MTDVRESSDLELLLIDGDNLLHAVRGRRDEGGTAWLLPRLARWRPPGLRVIVVLDGHPARGQPMRQGAYGIELLHAGSRSADDVIVDLLASRPYAERSRSAVVTRDRALVTRVHDARGNVHSPRWLLDRLGSEASARARAVTSDQPAGIGRSRPVAAPTPVEEDGEGSRAAWRPGRGATRKRGNARRHARRTRHG